VVEQLTSIAAGPALVRRTWVLLTVAPDGGWALGEHAHSRGDPDRANAVQGATTA